MRTRCSRTLMMAGLVAACLMSLPSVVFAQAAPTAHLQAATGQVRVRHVGSTAAVTLNTGDALTIGDVVATGPGAKASIVFYDGSQIRLNAGTTIGLTSQEGDGSGHRVLFSLLSGEVWAHLRPNWSIRTPTATAWVRGTTLDLIVRTNESVQLTTIEGQVDFFNQFGRVTVDESQQSIATPNAAPSAPVTIPNAGLIVEWSVDLNRAIVPREKSFTGLGRAALAADTPLRAARARATGATATSRRDYGDALYDAGHYADALAQYQRANSMAGNDGEILLRQGYALLELNRVDEAEGALRTAMGTPQAAAAQTGLAWLELRRDKPAAAETAGAAAVAAAPASGEAHLVHGIALLRLNRRDDAIKELQTAASSEPAALQYQARSWLALANLAGNDNAGALREAQAAVQMAPESSLAQANLAQVYFFSGQGAKAERAARLATQLNPNSPAAQVALAQALLAQGDTDGAADAAALAAAQDPGLAQAHYVLGVADASRRDYIHAVRSLRESTRLAPDFLPAQSALARVYTRQGRKDEAVALLTGLQTRQPNSDSVTAALGEVYYEQARYSDSMAQYQKAIELNPSSGLNQAGLARVALDANELNTAIAAGQKAVELAPQVGQYHAVLGLAYSFSQLNVQAEREFRSALTIDPANALALARLGLLNREGDARTASRTTAETFVQAFIYDPYISKDFLRGGIDTELGGRIGNKSEGIDLQHRHVLLGGTSNFLGTFQHSKDDGDRANSDVKDDRGRVDLTFQSGGTTNFYFRGFHNRSRNGLPNDTVNPVGDDRASARFSDGVAAVRSRLTRGTYVWAGVVANSSRVDRTNPNADFSFAQNSVSGGFGNTAAILSQTDGVHTSSPELRFDWAIGNSPEHSGTFTAGVAKARAIFDTNSVLQDVDPFLGTLIPGTSQSRQDVRQGLSYLQWAQRVGRALSFSAQVRRQTVSGTATGTGSLQDPNNAFPTPFTPDAVFGSFSRTLYLPSLVANMRAGDTSSFRLFASRRVTDVAPIIFAPNETLLTTEREALTTGRPDPFTGDQNVYELDFERQLSARSFLKLSAFHTTARQLRLDFSGFGNPSDFAADDLLENNFITLNRVSRSGGGARLEHQLGSSLFANFQAAFNRTEIEDGASVLNGQQAPYNPKFVAGFGLNYVDPRGYKFGVQVEHRGKMYIDGLVPVAARPQFAAKTYVNLRLAKEPSVNNEVFVQVNNVFDAALVTFNGIPIAQRRAEVGLTHRF